MRPEVRRTTAHLESDLPAPHGLGPLTRGTKVVSTGFSSPACHGQGSCLTGQSGPPFPRPLT